MFSILPNLMARLKILLLTFLVAELEADVIAAAAERKAELLRQAQQFEKDDMPGVAAQIRAQADGVALDRPLTSAIAAAHLQTSLPPASVDDKTVAPPPSPAEEAPQPTTKKKKSMSLLSQALARHVRSTMTPFRRRASREAGAAALSMKGPTHAHETQRGCHPDPCQQR